MRWVRKGQIFHCSQHKFMGHPVEFAQSPQALVLEDRVRVYFSTRTRDERGSWLSRVAYADYSMDFSEIIEVSDGEVISLGSLGTFDEHGIFPFSVFKDDKSLLAYTCGWSRRSSVPVETSVGLAFSVDNGRTFERIGEGPILGASLNEPFLVGDAFVRKDGNQYLMWYIFGVSWSADEMDGSVARVYKIGFAKSLDAKNWHKNDGHRILSDVLGEYECQALPTAIKIAGRWHMYFCFRYHTGFRMDPDRTYRLGYAWSDDLMAWHRDDAKVAIFCGEAKDWDSRMQCYPNIVQVHEKYYILYNGNQFGRDGFGLLALEE